MKRLFVLSGAVVLAACGSPAAEEEATPVAEAEAPVEAMSLNETSWSFVRDDQEYFETIDPDGNYIVNAGEEHSDHGTYAMVDGLHCFTSAMTDEGENCWTVPDEIAVGETVTVTSTEGDELPVTRVEYTPLTM